MITDFTAYNTRVSKAIRPHESRSQVEPDKLGLHWVGELMVEADVDVEEAKGELLLDLVEAGKHFTATIDLATGQAVLGVDGVAGFAPAGRDCRSTSTGHYRVAFANFDDQLRLWVDGTLVDFDDEHRVQQRKSVCGSREAIIPQTSDDDPGDLAPVGIGARGTKLDGHAAASVARPLLRRRQLGAQPDERRGHRFRSSVRPRAGEPAGRSVAVALVYRERNHVEFPLGEDQFFVMGDNSPESSDARLWLSGDRAHRRPPRRRVPRTTAADRQSTLRVLAPFLEPHPRHADPVSAVPQFRRHEVGEIEKLLAVSY